MPANANLAALTGEHVSGEAEVTLRAALEQARLIIHRRPDASIPLTPAYRDAFTS